MQHQTNSSGNLSIDETLNTSGTSVPRLPSVSRRLSLTTPVVLPNTNNASTPTTPAVEDETPVKATVTSSPSIRAIPIRFPHASMLNNNHARTTSAILRTVPKSNLSHHSLQRQKTDLSGESTMAETVPASSQRRADIMAREAIQGVVRFQQQQQQQAANPDPPIDLTNYNHISMRSPALSRRVIINLKNNQSISLDSRLLSANPTATKPPQVPSSARSTHRPYSHQQQSQAQPHHPVLQENIQMPSHPVTLPAESPPPPSSTNGTNAGNAALFKNEFRMEIPVTVLPNHHDQDHSFHSNPNKEEEDDLEDESQPTILIAERLISATPNSNPTLKSILKRSTSRETVSRKNVSFLNA